MAIAEPEITREEFIRCVGVEPRDDDLERCNCKKAGEPGHIFCGWNYKSNKPKFIDYDE